MTTRRPYRGAPACLLAVAARLRNQETHLQASEARLVLRELLTLACLGRVAARRHEGRAAPSNRGGALIAMRR